MYIATARSICLTLLMQETSRAFIRAWAKTGKRIAAKMAMNPRQPHPEPQAIRTQTQVGSPLRRGGTGYDAGFCMASLLSFTVRVQRAQSPRWAERRSRDSAPGPGLP